MPFIFSNTIFKEVLIVTPKVFTDHRGYFAETYKFSAFKNKGIHHHFVQTNHSLSTKGVIRGIHFQKCPKAQAKLVRCVRGEILDVIVDVRNGSPTYGQWLGENLSAENKKMFYIPIGFAHGFCVLSEEAEILYLSSEEYDPSTESGIIWNDPDLKIKWPDINIIVSDKDKKLQQLKEINSGFKYPAE
ncbi:MAG: dTDP-4-dehydrorhamnose 3,5-epimerase [Candidatus Omnitrophica bacterium]|nr:dTDP-4-dehydrorhamnose 3,5-epimerase [Candidatus Omnitrophota bacterium]